MALCRFLLRRRGTVFVGLVMLFIFVQLPFPFRFQKERSSKFRKHGNVSDFWQTDPRLKLYLKLIHGHGLPVFLVDPVALLPLILLQSREWISRDMAVHDLFVQYDNKDLTEPPPTILAGIEANDTGSANISLHQLIQTISRISQDAGFHAKVTENEVPSQFQAGAEDGNSQVPTHVVLTKNRYKLHIIIFHPSVNTTFFWTSAFTKPFYTIGFQSSNSFNIPLPDRMTIFDEFGLQTINMEFQGRNGTSHSVEILIPINILHFVQQLPHASYVECNRVTAAEFRAKYMYSKSFTAENQTMADTNSRYTLLKMKEILKNSFIPFWACFGTLLGWYRECSAIPYTTDLDFCSFSGFTTDEAIVTEILNYMRTEDKIHYFWTYGFAGEGLEMVFQTKLVPTTKQRFRADLFFMYPASIEKKKKAGQFLPPKHGLHSHVSRGYEKLYPALLRDEDQWVVYIHWYETKEYQFYHTPAIREFCSTDLWDLKVMVPCNPLPSLHNDYGKNEWKLAINEEFLYRGDISSKISWDESQKNLRTFGQFQVEGYVEKA